MERPISKPIGTPVEDLDTPALVVDLTRLGRNIETMHSFFRDGSPRLRPHVAAHGSPAIAHQQLVAGGTVGGIATSTLGQAEVFAASGLTDIYVANIIVTPTKIARLCALAHRVAVTVAVDSAAGVDALSRAATATGATLSVVVDVNTGSNGAGIEPGQPAVDLALAVERAHGLSFAGLSTREGTLMGHGDEGLVTKSRARVQRVLDTREDVERAGLVVRVVSAGGTRDYEIVADMDGVTEVPAGSYALMDAMHRAHRPQFANAARVMSCVTSLPEAGNVITDAGRKAIGADRGDPHVDGLRGARVRSLSAEHGGVDVDPTADLGLRLGDRVWFVPWDVAACVNLHDYIHAVRDGRLEAVWELPARGRYR